MPTKLLNKNLSYIPTYVLAVSLNLVCMLNIAKSIIQLLLDLEDLFCAYLAKALQITAATTSYIVYSHAAIAKKWLLTSYFNYGLK